MRGGAGFTARGGWWVAGQAVLFGVAAWSLLLADDPIGLEGDAGAYVRLAGVIVALAGAALAGAGWLALGRNLTPFPAPLPGGTLVAHGAYRLVRHPIYGGVALGLIGLGVAGDDLGALVVGVVLVGYFWAKSSFEERHLVATYPGYAAYREATRQRLIPWVL